MKKIMLYGAILLILVGLALATPQKASAGALTQVGCEIDGGRWVGASPSFGTCYMPPGTLHHTASSCTDQQYWFVTWPVSGPLIIGCQDINPYSGPGYGKCGAEAKDDGSGILATCRNGFILYDAGTCVGKCTVAPTVLNTAAKKLSSIDEEITAKLYVKVRNSEGTSSYQACFYGQGVIYRFVSGAWVPLPTNFNGTASCAAASGDGNFVLIEG